MEGLDTRTKSTLTKIPLLTKKAGPRDGEAWTERLKEEYKALIAYTSMNKSNDNDWFRITASNPQGTRWTGKCWYIHNLLKYEFDLQFDIPVTYPATAPELELPQLDGKTQKMYRGGKICLTVHFKPLWAKNWYFPLSHKEGRIGVASVNKCFESPKTRVQHHLTGRVKDEGSEWDGLDSLNRVRKQRREVAVASFLLSIGWSYLVPYALQYTPYPG
ncbi:Ubiquitin-fold modifier-conjugating enzyme 1 [Bienertia sinuspersici]